MDFAARLALRARLRSLLERPVERCGCRLVAVDLATGQNGLVLRLYIDRPGGVGVDDCARVSHAVSPELDVEDPFPGSWTLEVSSPGIDRPVELPEDFEAFAGFRARVKLGPGAGRRRCTGTLVGLHEGCVVIDVDGQVQRLPLDQVDRVRLVLEPDEYERLAHPALASGEPR